MSDLKLPEGVEIQGDRCLYRPRGFVSAWQLADLITVAVEQARERAVPELMVNISALIGFDSPGPAYRRWIVRRWAAAAGGQLRVAMVARPEHICPEKIGLLIAAEECLDAHICES